jgi:hypothetical protein
VEVSMQSGSFRQAENNKIREANQVNLTGM